MMSAGSNHPHWRTTSAAPRVIRVGSGRASPVPSNSSANWGTTNVISNTIEASATTTRTNG